MPQNEISDEDRPTITLVRELKYVIPDWPEELRLQFTHDKIRISFLSTSEIEELKNSFAEHIEKLLKEPPF